MIAKQFIKLSGVVTGFLGLFTMAMTGCRSFSAEDVLTQRNNNLRTGASSSPGLNQTSVRNFRRLNSLAVDDPVLAQPLFVQSVNFRGTRHSMVWIATVTNKIYAFDADTLTPLGEPIDLGPPYTPNDDFLKPGGCLDKESIMMKVNGRPIIGIESTPVIDRDAKTMFVSYRVNTRKFGEQRLAAIDITTGKVKSSVAVPGSDRWHELHRNRASLLLDRGTVFIAYAVINEYPRQCDYAMAAQGWIHAFDAATLIYRGAWRSVNDPNNKPNDRPVNPLEDKRDGGGIWQASTGLAADSQGNIFFATGNGENRPEPPDAENLTDSAVRLGTRRVQVRAPVAIGGPATMVTTFPNQQHIFYRAGDSSIQHIFWDAFEPPGELHNDNWTQWSGVLAAADPVAMATTVPNQQHIFYRAADGSIQHIFWDALELPGQLHNDNWTQRTKEDPAAGNPATMVTATPNQQHIFYRAMDGSIRHIFWDAATNQLYHDNWTRRTGEDPAAGDPATMVTATPNQQHIFYRAMDGSIRHIFWNAATNQLYHDNWTQRTKEDPAAGDPATMVTVTPNQQHVFYRAKDGSIRHIFWDAATNQLNHDNWTRRTGEDPAAGDPATMVTATPNQQHIFYRAMDGSIRHIFWDAATNQLYHDNWTRRTKEDPAAGDPAAMVSVTPNQQHVFYRAKDGSIRHIFWDAATNQLYHDNWTKLPDQIVMTPVDWFTPYRKIEQDQKDMDFGAAGVMLIPDTQYMVAGGKEGILYLLDRNHLGKFDNKRAAPPGCPYTPDVDQPDRDAVIQKFQAGIDQYRHRDPAFLDLCHSTWLRWPHIHGTPVFGDFRDGNAFLYVWPEKDYLKSFRWLGNRFETEPGTSRRPVERQPQVLAKTATTLAPPFLDNERNGMPGGFLSLNIDPTGSGEGVLFASIKTCDDGTSWAECSIDKCPGPCVTPFSQHGILRAFDPITLKELWNNKPDWGYDFAKFVPPTIAGSRVFLATASGQVLVYGQK